MWNLPAPPGFRGLDPDRPVKVYIRRLPHWRQHGATYFVTFRLSDSLPQNKLQELDALRLKWEQEHPRPHADEHLEQLAYEALRRVEHWLDQGMGSCQLENTEAARILIGALHYFDAGRYELGCYVVMPNHVHVIVRPLLCDDDALERILQSWKRHSSLEINQLLGLAAPFWQEESFDRIIRDEEHLFRAVQYIGSNPSRARLDAEACPTWIRPEWEKLGWKFEDNVTIRERREP
jgi:putative transposase